jgi:hypothetical protein
MPLFTVIFVLIVAAILLWLVNTYIPMDHKIKTVLGIAGLIYATVLFAITTSGSRSVKLLVVFSILGIIFFIAGIGLIRTTKDES